MGDVTNLNGTSQPNQSGSITAKVIDRLFKDLLYKYGMKWAAQWDGIDVEAVRLTWERDLSPYSVDDVVQALAALSSPFPPTLPEFRELCKQMRRPRDTFKPLSLTDERRVSREYLKSVKDIIGGKRPVGQSGDVS